MVNPATLFGSSSEPNARARRSAPPEAQLAGFVERGVGAVVDFVLGAVVVFFTWYLADLPEPPFSPDAEAHLGRGILVMAAYGALHAHLIVTRGQSVGKWVAGTRIVRTNGAAVDFTHGVLIRSWLFGLVSGFFGASLPGLLGNIILVLMAPQRQSLHDKLADTIVVKAPRAMRVGGRASAGRGQRP